MYPPKKVSILQIRIKYAVLCLQGTLRNVCSTNYNLLHERTTSHPTKITKIWTSNQLSSVNFIYIFHILVFGVAVNWPSSSFWSLGKHQFSEKCLCVLQLAFQGVIMTQTYLPLYVSSSIVNSDIQKHRRPIRSVWKVGRHVIVQIVSRRCQYENSKLPKREERGTEDEKRASKGR